MPRSLRSESELDYFHVMSRGTGKRDIFLGEADRVYFLRIVDQVVHDYEWLCHSYVLMNNHFHLILQTPLANLASGMQYLNGVYSTYFNRMHNRIGHVMQGRYGSRLLTSDEYFLTAIRYVLLNPVKDGFCASPGHWRWSSYNSLVGLERPPRFLQSSFLLGMFSDDPVAARACLQEFIVNTDERNLPIPYDELGELESSLEKDKHPMIARRVPLGDIFCSGSTRDARDADILEAYATHNYTMKEIASYLCLHESAISKIIKRMRQSLSP